MIRSINNTQGLNQLSQNELITFKQIISTGQYNERVVDDGPTLANRLYYGETTFTDDEVFRITYMLGNYLEQSQPS